MGYRWKGRTRVLTTQDEEVTLAVLEDRYTTPLAKTCTALAIGVLGYIQAIPVLISVSARTA